MMIYLLSIMFALVFVAGIGVGTFLSMLIDQWIMFAKAWVDRKFDGGKRG